MKRFDPRCWVFLALGCLLPACGDDDAARPAALSQAASLPALHAERGVRAGIYDAQGRQVLLRGVNVNALGDYYQGNPNYPQVLPVDDSDFAEMARYGLNVVRLILSWSALEPERDRIDRAYLARIRSVVELARRHEVYVVLDMHQDAWGKYIATPPGVSCPGGREAAIGWDGAPEWATLTDGASTCRAPGSRELAPAVRNAFSSFYANRDGIQEQFAKAWAALAAEFARDTTVAGYDLLNEPHFGASALGSGTQLGPLYHRVITAIRAAEHAAGGFGHVIFFEPGILFPSTDAPPPVDSITDDNVVFAPHNYAESINEVSTIEGWFDFAVEAAARFGTTFWVGEYGWFSDPPLNQQRLIRYARQEDRLLLGSAWWQWQQACGDPHSIGRPGGEPDSEQIHFRRSRCPGDVDLGPIPEWTVVLSRPYPRAAPGQLQRLESDGIARTLELEAESGATPGTLDLWIPAGGLGQPEITGSGIVARQVRRVAGGYRAALTVRGNYTVQVR